MFPVGRFLFFTAAVSFSVGALSAQSVISAKSGLVHYTEGDVTVASKPVVDKPGVFAEVKKDEQLETTQGRAEVLLTPGVFLRVGEQSAIRMLNASLADTRVEMINGRAMLEADTPMKGNMVTIVYQGYSTTFTKHGLYEFQTSPAQVKVYSGEVQVSAGDQTVTVREGKELAFTAALAQERFDAKDGDSLYRWSKVRSEYVSIANVSAARYAQSGSGFQNGFFGSGGPGSGGFGGYGNALGMWSFNNAYGMYTYLPFSGIGYSPFGYPYFSPDTVYMAYVPSYYAPGNYGTVSNNRLNRTPGVSFKEPGSGGTSSARGTSLPATVPNSTAVRAAPMGVGSIGHTSGRGK
jgi:hypothetical protein